MIQDTDNPLPLTALGVGVSARLHATRLDEDTRSLLRSLGLTDASRLRVCKCGEPLRWVYGYKRRRPSIRCLKCNPL